MSSLVDVSGDVLFVPRDVTDKLGLARPTADEKRGDYLRNEQAKQAGYYRYLTAYAQGMGYPSIIDALSDLAKLREEKPVLSKDSNE